MSSTPLVTGMVLGGVIISALGAGSTIFVEEKRPTGKSVVRDFLIGAALVAMIIQLLPESSTAVIQGLLGLVPLSLFGAKSLTGSGDGAASAASGLSEGLAAAVGAVDELEVKVGVPRF